jgi:hypothetical protein
MSKEGYVVDSTLGATSGAAVGALGTIVGSALIIGAAPAIAALVGVTVLGAAAGAAIGALAHKSHEKAAARQTDKPARRERRTSTAP